MLSQLLLSVVLLASPLQSPLGNKTNGLEITAPQEVQPSSELVTIEAKTNGTVKWLVISQEKLQFQESNSSLILNMPKNGKVTVFAIGLVDGKLTEYVTTSVTTKNQEKKKPEENTKPILDYKMRWR